MAEDSIHVCYAIHDKSGERTRHLGASLVSMFENTKRRIAVHLFHDEIMQEQDLGRIRQITEDYDQEFFPCAVHREASAVLRKYANLLSDREEPGKYPKEGAYRLLALELLKEEDRLILVDPDMLFHMDIEKLWDEDMGKHGIAAVPETANPLAAAFTAKRSLVKTGNVAAGDWMETGILLVSPSILSSQSKSLMDKVISWASRSNTAVFDMDGINRFLARKSRKLPLMYNVLVTCQRGAGNFDAAAAEGILRFTGNDMKALRKDSYRNLFELCFSKTPWHTEGKSDQLQFLPELLDENIYRGAAMGLNVPKPEELEGLAASGEFQFLAPNLFFRLIMQCNVINQLLLKLYRSTEENGGTIEELLRMLPAPMERIWRKWKDGTGQLQPGDANNYSTMLVNTFIARGRTEELARFADLSKEMGGPAVKATADTLANNEIWDKAGELYSLLPEEQLDPGSVFAYAATEAHRGNIDHAIALYGRASRLGNKNADIRIECLKDIRKEGAECHA